MNDTDNTEDHNQVTIKQNEKMETLDNFIPLKQSHELEQDSSLQCHNTDMRRAIESLKDMPDEELQEFLEEDFMEGLDVVDAWEGDEDKNRDFEHMTSTKEGEQPSREHHRRERQGSYNREKPKKKAKKREEIRRDPLKSSKDIERDKLRTKRDTESKILAEKEKAIKHLLDSDNVVPPGTETEAIQSITEKQNLERIQQRQRRSRERRKSINRYDKSSPVRHRSPDRLLVSPHRRRSPFMPSPTRRRSPFRTSIERHRSPFPIKRRHSPRYISDRRSPVISSPDRHRSPRRVSWDRRSSVDRKWSDERSRRRANVYERRRSRSRDRRSRSTERLRRRSSRSPGSRRYSPCRRSRTRSRTRSRSMEKHVKKRSPFISELARHLKDDTIMSAGTEYASPAIAPLISAYKEAESIPPSTSSGYVHQAAGPPPPPPSVLPMPNVPPSFMNFDIPSASMGFQPMGLHTLPPMDYSGVGIYNQASAVPMQAPPPPSFHLPLLPAIVSSPQPVPAPTMDHNPVLYNPSYDMTTPQLSSFHQFEASSKTSDTLVASQSSALQQSYKERRPTMPYNEFHAVQEERLKTPEPPVISKSKQFEKTSLSSLLEASVSAKDPSNLPILYPGFKPEIMQRCEHVMCQLPFEDPRLKMKGRFFYIHDEKDAESEQEDRTSNSILLQKGKSKLLWEENVDLQIPIAKSRGGSHQKICQTDEVEVVTTGVQASVIMADFASQVYPYDLQQINKEDRKPIMDRLDWNVEKPYEHDLRWNLSNSSQKRFWDGHTSPKSMPEDHQHHADPLDHGSKNFKLDPSFKNRDGFSNHKVRDHYDHDRYSPDYRHSIERDEFYDKRSDHSHGESPMELDNSDDESITEHAIQWHDKGKILRGKGHRGKVPYSWSRGNLRGKF